MLYTRMHKMIHADILELFFFMSNLQTNYHFKLDSHAEQNAHTGIWWP